MVFHDEVAVWNKNQNENKNENEIQIGGDVDLSRLLAHGL
jgi:hypothetical protein